MGSSWGPNPSASLPRPAPSVLASALSARPGGGDVEQRLGLAELGPTPHLAQMRQGAGGIVHSLACGGREINGWNQSTMWNLK